MCHRVDPSFRVDRLVATRESKRARPSLFWFFQIERDPRGRRRVKVGHQQDLNAGTWTRSSGIASGNTNDATRRTIRFDVTARTDRTHPAVSRTMLSFDFSPCLEGRVRFLAVAFSSSCFQAARGPPDSSLRPAETGDSTDSIFPDAEITPATSEHALEHASQPGLVTPNAPSASPFARFFGAFSRTAASFQYC